MFRAWRVAIFLIRKPPLNQPVPAKNPGGRPSTTEHRRALNFSCAEKTRAIFEAASERYGTKHPGLFLDEVAAVLARLMKL